MMDGTYFTVVDTEGNKAHVLTISGRMDTIVIVALEREVISHRITGRLFRASNSFETDELYYYALHHLRTAFVETPKRKIGSRALKKIFRVCQDPITPSPIYVGRVFQSGENHD
jgi:hypothetical protein